jgi:type VI secretion system protein ImpH
MGAAVGTADSAVDQFDMLVRLAESPGAFDFFQLVRLLELAGKKPRFHSATGLAFAAGDTKSVVLGDGRHADVTVNFMGLVGPLGALPYYYSELATDRAREKDHALAAFFDLFHHRIIELFHAAWRKHRFPVPWEQREDEGVTSALKAVLGIRTPGLEDRLAVPDEVLLFHAGLLGLQSRPAVALQQILESHFEVPATVEEFAGAWSVLPEAHQCRLGSESISEQLGMGTILGDAIWDQQSHARVRLGPMPLARYRDFLPGGAAHDELRAITAFFSDRQVGFEIQLVLDSQEVPACELGEDLPLGWCSWLSDGAFAHHPDDAILPLEETPCPQMCDR